jgi:hypothetical protein
MLCSKCAHPFDRSAFSRQSLQRFRSFLSQINNIVKTNLVKIMLFKAKISEFYHPVETSLIHSRHFNGIESKRSQVKTSPTLRSQNVPRPKRPQAKHPQAKTSPGQNVPRPNVPRPKRPQAKILSVNPVVSF